MPWADSYHSALRQVLAALPGESEIIGADEHCARAVLGLLLRAAAASASATEEPWPEDPATCPNCGAPTTSERSPYCGAACREESGLIRSVRSAIGSGALLDPEKQLMMGQLFWSQLGAGYPLRVAQLPVRVVEQVLARSEGLCAVCRQPAALVEHIATGCNRPINLHAVCPGCARTRPFCDPEFLNTPRVQSLMQLLALRTGSATALRVSDDPGGWDWRAFMSRRPSSRRPR